MCDLRQLRHLGISRPLNNWNPKNSLIKRPLNTEKLRIPIAAPTQINEIDNCFPEKTIIDPLKTPPTHEYTRRTLDNAPLFFYPIRIVNQPEQSD